MSSERIHRHLVFHGRVQGVGYRVFVQRAAAQLGVDAHARNLDDGTVACDVSGSPDAVDALIERLRQGPPMARVDRVDTLGGSDSGDGRKDERAG